MFTGLVETKGTLVRRFAKGGDARLVLSGDLGGEPLALGESIAVEGACLTVAAIVDQGPPRVFEADASAETLSKTTLGKLRVGAPVNLERAVALGARMGGHIVSGHVDGVGHVAGKEPMGGALEVSFEVPAELAKYIAPKGSITVNGVSLTVNGVSGARFDVALIPHTREKTTLDALGLGDAVNIEVDVLARYVLRFLEASREERASSATGDATLLEALGKSGYL